MHAVHTDNAVQGPKTPALGAGKSPSQTEGNTSMTKFSVRTLLAALAITLLWRPALAMEFQRAGKVIHGLGGTSEAIQASGVIEHGDTQKFLAFVRVNGAARTDNWTVELSSPGGNLIEGIALGQAFRNAGMVTSVRRGNVCMSACAIAYLGGVYVGAAGEGVGRQLEFGATLGFHGFKSDNDGVEVISQTISTSRIVTALILTYAADMKGVDIGWLSEALTVPPESIYLVSRPHDIRALSIELMNIPTTIPKEWFLNACRAAVAPFKPDIDYFGERVTPINEVIPTVKRLRQLIVTTRFASEAAIASALAPLNDRDAISVVLPNWAVMKPILDARLVNLERGAGFYYDQCIAVRDEHTVSAVLLDLVGHSVAGGFQSRLAMFDDKGKLW
jgi:hypothetical protein